MVSLRLSLTTNVRYHSNQGSQTAGGKEKGRTANFLRYGRGKIGPRGWDKLRVTIWQLNHQPVASIAVYFADYFEHLIQKWMPRKRNSNAL
jgi:hypothetical protein